MRVFGDRVLIKHIEKLDYSMFGEVIDVGCEVDNVSIGDKIYFDSFDSTFIVKNSTGFSSIREIEILAVEEETKNFKCECNH